MKRGWSREMKEVVRQTGKYESEATGKKKRADSFAIRLL